MIDQAPHPDIQMWWAFALALISAIAGEAWRGDQDHLHLAEILRRIAFRSGAAAVLAVGTLWVLMSMGAPTMLAGAVAGVAGLSGADVALAIYLAVIRRRLGLQRDGEQ